MARKNVAIRLITENGRRVRAELEGVADAGRQSFQRMSREVDLTGVAIRRLAGIATAAFSTRQIVSYTNRWADMNSSLKLATGSAELGRAVLSRLGEVARRSTSDLGQVVDGYIGFSRVLNELGVSVNDQLDFVETLSTALDISGIRADKAAQVQTALSRAMALGTLQGQNLNTVIQNGGRVAQALADSLGVSTGELYALGRAGKIGRAEMLGMASEMEKLRKEAEGMTDTIADAFRVMGNSALELIGRWDELLGASSLVADALILVADNLGRAVSYAIALGTAIGVRMVAAFGVGRAATLALSTALVGLRAALARTGVGLVVVAVGELFYRFMLLSEQVGSVGNSISLLWQIAKSAFKEIGQSARAMGELMSAVAWGMAKHFVDAFAWIARRWDDLVNLMLAPFNEMMALMGRELRLVANSGIGDLLDEASAKLGDLAEGHVAKAREIYDGMELTKASVEALLEAMNKAVDLDKAPPRLPPDTPPGGAGGTAGARQRALKEERDAAAELIKSLRQESAVLRELDPVKRKMLEYSDQLAGATARQREQVLELVEALREQEYGFAAVSRKLAEYADEAGRIGSDIGDSLVGAFRRAEDAVAEFVKTGKLNFSDLVSSILSDLARISTRHFITGPLSGALSDRLGGAGGGIFANLFHSGGVVGAGGPGRMVPALAFANAPRMHGGGIAGLRSDEVPAILQTGERVLNRREAAAYSGGGVTVHIHARDAESFRQSRSQVAADIARAVNLGRRGM